MGLSSKIIKKLLWFKLHYKLSEKSFINLLSLFIGFTTGIVAVLLKTIVHNTSQFVKSLASIDSSNYLFFAFPLIGILLTFLFVKYHVKDTLSHGISRVLFAISKKSSFIPPHNNYSSLIASTLTVGFGGSVGLEAPVVLTGASIGSNFARIFNLSYRARTLLLGCGAAAAISSIFKAPIAGTVFALEVLMLDLSVSSIIPLLISAVMGSLVSALLLGQKVVFNFAVFEAFNIDNTLLYVLLGIFCGFIGLYFTKVLEKTEFIFSNIKNQFVKILLGGGILGLLIYFFPPLYGEGYESLADLFSNHPTSVLNHSYFLPYFNSFWLVSLFLLLVILFKAIASSLTTTAGGVGGVFGPSLFLGGVTGYLFSSLINHIQFIDKTISTRNFSLVGMAGVLSAVMQSPLTAIFLIAEITGGYSLFVPIIITSTVAYITIHQFESYSVNTKRLAVAGELITHDKDLAVLTLLNINELVETDFKLVNINGVLGDLIVEVAQSNRNAFVVVDAYENFKGIISLDDIRNIMFDDELYEQVKIKSLMKQPPTIILQSDTAAVVMDKFKRTKAWNLPVVDENNKYIGFLSKSKILSNYREVLVNVSHHS
jgi:CIC family chloride channel protein